MTLFNLCSKNASKLRWKNSKFIVNYGIRWVPATPHIALFMNKLIISRNRDISNRKNNQLSTVLSYHLLYRHQSSYFNTEGNKEWLFSSDEHGSELTDLKILFIPLHDVTELNWCDKINMYKLRLNVYSV